MRIRSVDRNGGKKRTNQNLILPRLIDASLCIDNWRQAHLLKLSPTACVEMFLSLPVAVSLQIRIWKEDTNELTTIPIHV
jgi:hypothetical protein